jgi:hypothetical protein
MTAVTSPHRRDLEGQLARLRSRRVQLRKRLEWFAKGHIIQDPTETARQIRETQMALKDSELEFDALHHALGLKRYLGPPIKLALRPDEVRRIAAYRSTTVTKAMPNSVKSSEDWPSFKTGEDWLKYTRAFTGWKR